MKHDDRLIIILGMAHSGTTILTYVLKQHPNIVCCINGNEELNLENDYLVTEETQNIQDLLLRFPDHRIMLKRPWTEVWHANWLRREMPNAKFIYCYRGFEDIAESWSKPTSMVSSDLRDGSIEFKKEYYDYCFECARVFSETVPNFHWHYYPTFVMESPARVAIRLIDWLNLKRVRFDTSMVGKSVNIKDVILKERVR
jgi:hypothetical protein